MAMKKGVKITIIIIVILLVLLIAAAAIVGLYYKNKYDKGENFDFLSYKVRNFSYEEEIGDFKAGNTEVDDNITQVYIDWAYGKVIIDTYEGSAFRVEEEGAVDKDDTLQWYQNGNILYVNYRKSGRVVYKGDKIGKTLHFYVPSERMSTSLLLDVWTVSADIEAKDLVIGDIDTVTESGKSTFRNLDVYTSSFESDTGTIDLELANYNNIDVISKSGKIDIYTPEDKGFCLEYDGVPEKLTSEFKFDPEVKTGGGVYLDEKMIIRLTNESGKTNIKKFAVKEAEK